MTQTFVKHNTRRLLESCYLRVFFDNQSGSKITLNFVMRTINGIAREMTVRNCFSRSFVNPFIGKIFTTSVLNATNFSPNILYSFDFNFDFKSFIVTFFLINQIHNHFIIWNLNFSKVSKSFFNKQYIVKQRKNVTKFKMAMHIDNNIRNEYKKKSGENSFSSFTYLVMTRHVIIIEQKISWHIAWIESLKLK